MFVQLIAEDQMQRKHCFEIIVIEMYLSSLLSWSSWNRAPCHLHTLSWSGLSSPNLIKHIKDHELWDTEMYLEFILDMSSNAAQSMSSNVEQSMNSNAPPSMSRSEKAFFYLLLAFCNSCSLFQQCSTVNKQQCSTVNEQQCSTVNEQQCSTVNERKCNTVNKQQCSTVNEQQCSTVNERQCSTVNEQKCNTVNKQQCSTVMDRQCSTSYEQECRSVFLRDHLTI